LASLRRCGSNSGMICERERPAEQIALHLDATERPDRLQLLRGLDAFGGRRHVEVGGKPRDHPAGLR
jgi:hypothetical protein